MKNIITFIKPITVKKRQRLLQLLCCLSLLHPLSLRAQPEAQNWYFGNGAAVSFAGGAPVAISGSAMFSAEGSSCVSDSNGNLLFYTNSETVWNRNNQPMPNGRSLGGNYSATQGSIIVQNPANVQQYYLFISPEVAVLNLAGGLRYCVVDMTADMGRGDVGPISVLFNPTTTSISERLTAVRHTNGVDTWIITHNFPGNTFYAFLLSSTGIRATPVVSSTGTYQSGGGGNFNTNNSVGYLRASGDSRRLAMATRNSQFELFDFDNSTGQVSNAITLGGVGGMSCYGMEFSPDNTKLYGSTIGRNRIYQWNLAAGSATAIIASATPVALTSNIVGGLSKGPDGKIYVAVVGNPSLASIPFPNALGISCGYINNAVPLNGRSSEFGLCNFPNSYAPVTAQPVISVPLTLCVNEAAVVSTPAGAVPAGSVFTWDFGDPGSGSNTATGTTATHRYATPGSYVVTLFVTTPTATLTTQQALTVSAPPAFSLGPRVRTICEGQVEVLSPGPVPAGSTYRWQDGSTSPTFTALTAGRYTLEVTSPQGCRARDSVEVRTLPKPDVRLGPDTVICEEATPVILSANPQPAGSTYRWQDGSTSPTFTATVPGTYWLEVRNQRGCTALATIGVKAKICRALLIPNLITPNGDALNQTFVLQGLNAPDWSIRLYSRWGREIFAQDSYDNRWAAQNQPNGLYYYLLTNAQTGQKLKGWLEVVR